MALLYLTWDNSPLSGNPNVISQRVSHRITSIGGAYSTADMSPTNDMSTATNSATFTNATPNVVYEFKVETICTEGGPTVNDNGNQEGIQFECIVPEFSSDGSSITVHIPLSGTDITKIRLNLRRVFDGSSISIVTVTRASNAVDHVFTGLDAGTAYYLEEELYATVNGVDAISTICGDLHDSNYVTETTGTALCHAYEIQGTDMTLEWDNCDGSYGTISSVSSLIQCMRTGSYNLLSGSISGVTDLGDCS